MCQNVCDMYPIHALVSSLNHNITSKIEIQNSLHLVLMSTNWCTVLNCVLNMSLWSEICGNGQIIISF